MSDMKVIASETLFGQKADGEKFPITIEIGEPFKWDDAPSTEWACWLKVEPFLDKPQDIHGRGSLQAVCLALQTARSYLNQINEDGGRLTDEDGAEFPLNSYWPENPY